MRKRRQRKTIDNFIEENLSLKSEIAQLRNDYNEDMAKNFELKVAHNYTRKELDDVSHLFKANSTLLRAMMKMKQHCDTEYGKVVSDAIDAYVQTLDEGLHNIIEFDDDVAQF